MRRTIWVLCIAALAFTEMCYPLRASININVKAVEKTVVFLYSSDVTGAVDTTKPIGTGFLVGVPLKSNPDQARIVLVTARHMIDPVWAHCAGQRNPTVIYARVNKKPDSSQPSSDGVKFVQIPLTADGKPTWIHPTDDAVDAAINPFPLTDDIDIEAVPVALFPTPEETARLSIGDAVMSAGLLPSLAGNNRNYPIFKFGYISNVPSENIKTHCTAQAEFDVKVWLIAANLVPGNSGSPIFHVPLGGSGLVIGETRPMLLGVQSISFLGADVAGMTPIQFVYEMLQQQQFPEDNLRRGLEPPVPLPKANGQKQ
jgi:hypothetical protein